MSADKFDDGLRDAIDAAVESQSDARYAAKLSKVRGEQAKRSDNPISRAVYGKKSNDRVVSRAKEDSREMRKIADEKSSPNHRVKAR